ncbi:MAG TPA: penicillin-binding transpeptidase domain-containing protein [Patescibacteria group bacterium]|nr:penicillin-binding transpeptidase domain-containing protein [Patescibacteria group bacterium]
MKNRFGKAFGDELKKTARVSGHFHRQKVSPFEIGENLLFIGSDGDEATNLISPWTKSLIAILLIGIFALLTGRVFHLQVVRGKENLELADSNRIQIKTVHAPRGVIYDRNGKILAANAPGFRVLSASSSGSQKAVYITREEALNWEVKDDPRLINLEIDSLRTYAFNEKASHILGYLSEITGDELKQEKYSNYKIGDKIGRSGIEEAYEKTLKGIDGGEIIEVDASGRRLRTIREKPAVPGQNLILTVDIDLQSQVFDRLSDAVKKAGSCCAAAVVTDPKTGEILALVSLPGYNPGQLGQALVAANSPLLNRVIAGEYPPGSTFKIASGLAGLESGKITAETKFEDTGIMALGPYTFANWNFTQYGRKEEGLLDLPAALKRSNDIFFYQLGQSVGEKGIAEVAKKLGFGKKIGIDILGEEAGLVPDPDWKKKNIGEVWYPGDTLHMAIGQGFLLSTPLQVSNLISFIASGGKQYPPHLGLEIKDSKRGSVKQFKYDPVRIDANMNYLNLIKTGLEEVPKSGGTAWPFFTFPVRTAGKTGTAEFGDVKKTHAWYTAYAPVDDPKITATVLIEGGGEGSSVASPVVKEIFRWYFSPDKNNLIRDIGAIATDSAKILGE